MGSKAHTDEVGTCCCCCKAGALLGPRSFRRELSKGARFKGELMILVLDGWKDGWVGAWMDGSNAANLQLQEGYTRESQAREEGGGRPRKGT